MNNLLTALQRKFHRISISSKIIALVIIHLLLVFINIYTLNNFIKTTRVDAKIINESGIIRGSIQKVVKLEISGKTSDKDIKNINYLLDKYIQSGNKSSLYEHNNFVYGLNQVNNNWEKIKKLIIQYRESKDNDIKEELLNKSEHCWENANHTVGLAQYSSEQKFRLFSEIYYVIFMDVILMIFIIAIIYSIVKLKLEKQARIDPLTKVYNRHVFYEEIEIEMSSSKRHQFPLSIILLDIDFFKKVNDTYGHDEGDKVLVEFANLIKTHSRQEDILCRFGGEEFVIITPYTNIEKSKEFAEKLRTIIENNDFGQVGAVTASIGVTTQNDSDTLQTLFKRADDAVYISKENGRNRVSYL